MSTARASTPEDTAPAAPPGAGPPIVGDALAEVLRANRDEYNALVADQRLHGSAHAHEVLADGLRGPIDRLASAVPADRRAAVVDAAFRAGLVLAGRGLDLAGTGAMGAVWELLPDLAGAVAEAPARVIGSLSNATLAVRRHGDVARWHARLLALAAIDLPADRLLAWGRVAAWTSGLAQHRERGLAVLAADDGHSPRAAAAAVLGDSDAAQQLAGWDPMARWSSPGSPARSDNALVLGQPVGAFVAFGGQFSAPPAVCAAADGSLVAIGGQRDGEWTIHADVFGSVLTRRRAPAGEAPAEHAPSWPTPPGPVSTTAATANTQVWAKPYSHVIGVRGRVIAASPRGTSGSVGEDAR